MTIIFSTSVSKTIMSNLEKARQDSGNGGSLVGRAPFEHSFSITSTDTEITNIAATGNIVPVTIMPPEVFDSTENVNFTTDVWSFGVLLWEMFTGGEDVNRHLERLHANSSRGLPYSSKLC